LIFIFDLVFFGQKKEIVLTERWVERPNSEAFAVSHRIDS